MKAVADKDVVEKLARFGYLAYGLIYIIIMRRTRSTVRHRRGRDTDGSRLKHSLIRHQPLGKQAVLFTAIGLAAYALWSLIQLRPQIPTVKVPVPRVSPSGWVG